MLHRHLSIVREFQRSRHYLTLEKHPDSTVQTYLIGSVRTELVCRSLDFVKMSSQVSVLAAIVTGVDGWDLSNGGVLARAETS
jgi:hypothetical protein